MSKKKRNKWNWLGVVHPYLFPQGGPKGVRGMDGSARSWPRRPPEAVNSGAEGVLRASPGRPRELKLGSLEDASRRLRRASPGAPTVRAYTHVQRVHAGPASKAAVGAPAGPRLPLGLDNRS